MNDPLPIRLLSNGNRSPRAGSSLIEILDCCSSTVRCGSETLPMVVRTRF